MGTKERIEEEERLGEGIHKYPMSTVPSRKNTWQKAHATAKGVKPPTTHRAVTLPMPSFPLRAHDNTLEDLVGNIEWPMCKLASFYPDVQLGPDPMCGPITNRAGGSVPSSSHQEGAQSDCTDGKKAFPESYISCI